MVGICVGTGCSRKEYRMAADAEVSCLISEKICPQWMVPDRLVTPDPRSRMADLTDPDCPPMPPDDPSAHCWMQHPGHMQGSKKWGRFGQLPFVEFPDWKEYLPTNEDGSVELNQTNAIQLSLLHSREYQQRIESLYRQALSVSLERFDFDTRWFAGTGSNFTASGRRADASRALSVTNRAGFNRDLAAGGQLLADFANTFSWEFANGQISAATSTMLFRLTQPLLRGAFRDVRLESLTQAERNLLYAIRDYAQFRRSFYVDTVGGGGYLGLLEVAQSIRNQEANLQSLARNMEEHEALAASGVVAQIQVDQIFQDFEQGRLSLLASQQSLETTLDNFKIQLGLPPTLPVVLDQEILRQFELNDPIFDELEKKNKTLRLDVFEIDGFEGLGVEEKEPPTIDKIRPLMGRLIEEYAELAPVLESIQAELENWQSRLDTNFEFEGEDERLEHQRRVAVAQRLEGLMEEIRLGVATDTRQLKRLNDSSNRLKREDLWGQFKDYVYENYREHMADLFVIQAQIRVYLIEITRVRISEQDALAIAELNRLDLMNARGRVVDAYRRVEVAADALEGDLNLTLETEIGTDPGHINAFRFDSSANRYRAGVQFDGPVTRLAERNAYRSAQIAYQQARRDYMATKDEVARQIRADLRRLTFNRFQFEITRQQLITAARQVEQAQFALVQASEANSNLTRDLLSALQQLLGSKNSLIGSWVSYETSRMNLFRDLATMQIDEEGEWINEHDSIGTDETADESASNDAAQRPIDDGNQLDTDVPQIPAPQPNNQLIDLP